MTIESSRHVSLHRLDYYYSVIQATILSKQNAASGLMPASVAITSHGDYTDAWVRDNVYSIYAVYGLALAYRRIDDDSGRAFELEHAVIKLMRGLLFSMMRQAPKVEEFKKTQTLENALHAKYNTATGETVVGDFEWGHLQIDATSLFLVALADMTTSGMMIIYTHDEVDFVQNLVFYIERAYRTPDYGIWERGNKINHGQPELNSSSIGMAVAALRAINGINMFGKRGGPSSVIHVLPDELTRNATTLHSFLPRESNSKEIDGSVLSVISFPAFACTDADLIQRTKTEAKTKLEGKYGWKRFLRDGHQTELEDTSRLHYNPNELKQFENIESEWPLFFAYLVLDGLFTGDYEQAKEYREKLDSLIIESKGPQLSRSNTNSDTPCSLTLPLIPELYYVPRENIEAEKQNPRSQIRVPNDNLPLVWAMSLYFLGGLISDELLSPSEIDPLGRRMNVSKHCKDTVVQIVLLSEDEALQNTLSLYGLETQTINQISSTITVLPANALAEVYAGLGMNEKLKMSGRPKRPVGILGTSRLYRMQGHVYAFTPHFMDNDDFYLNSDPDYLASAFESELRFTSQHWFYPGRPTVVVLLSNALLGGMRTFNPLESNSSHNTSTELSRKNLLNFFMQLRGGTCDGVRVRLSRLSETINTGNIESLDFLISKPDIDWEYILLTARASRYKSMHRKLGYSETITQAGTPGHKTPRLQGSTFQKGGHFHGDASSDKHFKELTSALSRLASSMEPSFRLKDHEDTMSAARKNPTDNHKPALTQSPHPEMLALTLGDPSSFQQAVQSLSASVNLYDQIDLMQYLLSCESMTTYIETLESTLQELLEEVYLKARRLQYWSIARQAAGLLHKNVPSLTISITDLIIRQKQVSIGSGDREYLITTPVGPDALNTMLAEYCTDDIREGPVVQEIIIYLGSFIRTHPSMFDGILRLRTHHIIIALREEVRRMSYCDEEEAIEHLLQLSPFELKSLLATVLSPHLSDHPHAKPGYSRRLSQSIPHTDPSRSIPISVVENAILIRAQSGGYLDGNFATVDINGMVLLGEGRGVHVWRIDPEKLLLLEHLSFDTHISEEASEALSNCLESLQPDTIVIVACKDDMTEHITSSALFSLEALGSEKARDVQYRDSYIFIGKKGGHRKDNVEAHTISGQGPTAWIEKHIDIKTHFTTEVTADTIGLFFPNTNGKWHHRRKNDGALNRVPQQFFSDTWKLLDRSQGLKINEHRLLRDPTVLEMTAEEFNFALAVEGFLGLYTNPAERQVAVETLTVMTMIQQRYPDKNTMEAMIDLPWIMNRAIQLFWDKWIASTPRLQNCSFLSEGADYHCHYELAGRLFYDLPQQGAECTFTYLTKAILETLA
ncbi:glycosyl hydrolases family 15-domain-containing protein [Spinellus fusiger]|nr:glycosyl hydrolases family 15-domain-containing protein [Spinellus fusiger]